MPAATNTAEPSFNVVVSLLWSLTECAARSLHQIRLDEDIDVAVEHAVDVADLLLRAVVLDELEGLHRIAADLAAERNPLLRAADLLEPGLLFLLPQVVQPRLQYLHCR